MATSWKSQQGDGMYSLQFETDDIDKYKLVEKASQMAIDGIAEADVVEVVRCKDCEYREPIDERISYKGKHPMHCTLKSVLTDDDDYCKYGRRKDNEN